LHCERYLRRNAGSGRWKVWIGIQITHDRFHRRQPFRSWFTIALKRAGWDAVVIHGASETWVNIFIDDDRIEFRDATRLLGLGTFETEEAIRAALGDDQVRSATIGPAGENMVRYANITNDGRQAGRTDTVRCGDRRNSRRFLYAARMASRSPTRRR
jgi:hypothetical protein